jgi:hypothetical protein
MAKSLSERIAERVRQRKAPPGRGGENRAAFLALRDDIAKALADGWSARAIWETLRAEGKIRFSYDPFTRYVKKLIEQPAEQPAVSPATPSDQSPVAAATSTPRAAAERPDSAGTVESGNRRHERRQQDAGFRLNPTSKKEDML